MGYKIDYASSIEKDLKRLDKQEAKRILNKIETELKNHPGLDKALTGAWKGLFSYRIGQYRVIYSVFPDRLYILRIGHRREVYRN